MHGLWSNLFKSNSPKDETRSLLANTTIFAKLSNRELDSIDRIMYKRYYDAGETIFQQGDPGIGMYIIRKGIISIIQMPAEHHLAELNAGDFFGEIALLNETPRSAAAVAKTECTLLCVSQPDLLGLFRRNPKLAYKVLLPLSQITGQRVIQLDQDVLELHQQISELSTTNGSPKED